MLFFSVVALPVFVQNVYLKWVPPLLSLYTISLSPVIWLLPLSAIVSHALLIACVVILDINDKFEYLNLLFFEAISFWTLHFGDHSSSNASENSLKFFRWICLLPSCGYYSRLTCSSLMYEWRSVWLVKVMATPPCMLIGLVCRGIQDLCFSYVVNVTLYQSPRKKID